MGDVKNLASEEAIKKSKELVDEIKTCMFCTYNSDKMVSRPMSSQQVDEEGNVWFLSDKTSNKNREIKLNNKVDLLYGMGHDKFLMLHGRASVSEDKEKIKELWTPIAKVWMQGGVDDPRLCAIKIAVTDGYYWDVKHGKMVEYAKMAAALITGKTMDDGIEGRINK